ncbi:hypothetical protein J422_03693 [Methanocaldococcus villosus KIN24-T80]|uniref:Nucleoside transporter/FeoB GTPase Gate domain-containing protein n=1 Tax=Methanocaldococcus villosus KIN24-T80 TaxID=1069083 RepID=N6VQP2_9EURY|nr:nucleoside recognition domain-containing protein [Methanocaldococcus villosus]ENN96215.1 hypothetical protein J422_03693 [Methanocaldococcus villosus KIN24-T80]
MVIVESLLYTIKISSVSIPTVFIFSYLINAGMLDKLSKILHPILRYLNVNPISISSILSCFFSPTVGYSILAEAYRERKIDENVIIATSLANSFPSILSHTLTFFIPIVIPILGFTGLIFILIRIFVSLVKSIIGFIYLTKVKIDFNENVEYKKLNRGECFNLAINRTLKFTKRFVPIMFITLTIVLYLNEIKFFDIIKNLLYPITKFLNLNPNVIVLALSEFINAQSAIILAGEFLKNNILTQKEILIGLIIGNVVTFSTRYVKHSLPLHISLFGVKLGSKIVLINAVITLILDIFIIIILLTI